MNNDMIFTGKSVDDALMSALEQLGVDKSEISYEILEQEKKGILGIGSAPARIKITRQGKKNGAQTAVAYVKALLENMGIESDVRFEKTTSNRYKLTVDSKDAGVLIGHHGDTLDSLQYLVNLAVNKKETDGEKGEYMNITVDIENYREKREEALRSLARRMAAKVLKYKRSVTLEPMLPYERRIIHSEVQSIEGVSTNSVGVDNNRKVVIFLEEVGFQKSMERDGRRSDRPRTSRTGERRGSKGFDRRSSSVTLPKIEKKPAVKIDDDYDDGDYSSTAYLREPAKRFSSFEEYEQYMASLASQGEKKETDKEEATGETNE